jgi:hypothetical protein
VPEAFEFLISVLKLTFCFSYVMLKLNYLSFVRLSVVNLCVQLGPARSVPTRVLKSEDRGHGSVLRGTSNTSIGLRLLVIGVPGSHAAVRCRVGYAIATPTDIAGVTAGARAEGSLVDKLAVRVVRTYRTNNFLHWMCSFAVVS